MLNVPVNSYGHVGMVRSSNHMVFRIIPEFEILKKIGLKMLNSADNNSFSDLISVYLKIADQSKGS